MIVDECKLLFFFINFIFIIDSLQPDDISMWILTISINHSILFLCLYFFYFILCYIFLCSNVMSYKKKSSIKHVQKHVIVIDDSLDIPKFKKKISSMVSSNCALILQTNGCSSSLTITCSCLNKKSTNVKVFHGSLLILAWILLQLLNWLRRYIGH